MSSHSLTQASPPQVNMYIQVKSVSDYKASLKEEKHRASLVAQW